MIQQGPLSQKNGKVISSKKPCLRRRKLGTSCTTATAPRQRPVKKIKTPDFIVIDIDDPPPLPVVPAMNVKTEDAWLCNPGVAHVSPVLFTIVAGLSHGH